MLVHRRASTSRKRACLLALS
uniref:Uncharacterized protein n=1 Tax=Ralstonia solanacearum TaxID=305 RepID=A0A0S4U1D1_RALSL|nr:protein of unknown function [Ralstonia solanacearum]